jgi:phosphoribosylformylglycinamidine synthase
MVWHRDSELPQVDLVVLPGGFSYGDYLRCGAMASQSAIMRAIKAHADRGGAVLGICNGFQVLTEAHLLPGALMRNANLQFVCRPVALEVNETQSAFTRKYEHGQRVVFPVAHGDGNYFADDETLNRLEGEGRVALRYAPGQNPNGSARDIAGILNQKRNVLGLMPHPERVVDPLLGGTDGIKLFQGLLETLS